MKNRLFKLVLSLLLLTFLSGSAWAQTRIATVDVKKVFENYWKKKQAEAVIKELKDDMAKEDNNMRSEFKKMGEDYQALLASASDSVVSTEEREKRKKAAEDKLRQINDLKEQIGQYERTAQGRLQDQSERSISRIIDEIRSVVSTKAKAGGFSLVIDAAAVSPSAAPVVLYTNNENDMTDAVLLALNSTAPSEPSKSEEKPAAKNDDKKKDNKK